ncbi:hypothetical protein M9458_012485, partial [Cirrhinus mrigala]
FLVSSVLPFAPGFPVSTARRLPSGLSLVLLDYSLRLACDLPVCSCFDPACTTMSLSGSVNKSWHMDPLASGLVHPVTEQSVTTGSSSFTPGHSTDMDTDRILFRIKQGPRTLEQYIREFLAIANHSTLPDCTIIEIFCDGINEPLKAKMRREGPRSSLAAFMDFALLCVGSPFTVGVADGERDATEPLTAWIAREMAAVAERARAMAATLVPVHKMAAAPEHIRDFKQQQLMERQRQRKCDCACAF